MYTPTNKGVISPRTGKNTVAIVGFAEATRHLVPYDDKDTEIWGINDAYIVKDFMKRWDRWFQIHPIDYLENAESLPRDIEHMKWLEQNHEFPVYMQQKFERFPSSVKYPLSEVSKVIGRRYLTSSFAFMFGLAWLEGFQRIEVYGFEMKTFSEYAHQRPNAEYLIGKAEGSGVEVFLPALSSLCKGPLYGYKDLDISYRQEMEYMHEGLKDAIITQGQEFNYLKGYADALKDLKKTYPELKESFDAAAYKADEKVAQLNNTMGREQQAREFVALYDEIKIKELKNE